jgi:hypothetical protein
LILLSVSPADTLSVVRDTIYWVIIEKAGPTIIVIISAIQQIAGGILQLKQGTVGVLQDLSAIVCDDFRRLCVCNPGNKDSQQA